MAQKNKYRRTIDQLRMQWAASTYELSQTRSEAPPSQSIGLLIEWSATLRNFSLFGGRPPLMNQQTSKVTYDFWIACA